MRKTSLTKQFIFLSVALVLASCTLTPEPFTTDELALIAESDRELIFSSQELLSDDESLSLEQAFAMALKYNLENRVMLLEETLANDSFDLSKADLLPDLAASAGYVNRTNTNGSFSTSINTGNVSLEPSSSQEREQSNGEIKFSWNLLDFGVSYLTAKQGADNYLVAQKAREKVMLTLLQEVRSAYWNAVAMEAMEEELDSLYANASETLTELEINRRERLQDPISVLTEIRAIVEILQVLDQVRQSINTSRTNLATLINVQGYETVNLDVPETLTKLYRVSEDTNAMELYALANSADYMTEVYNVRIEQDETKKAMLRLLPGLEFSYGENYSSNRFILNDQWGQMGVNLTGDLMRLVNVGTIRKFRETSEQLTISRRLAVNMAVIAGVNITWQDYQNSILQYERAALLKNVDAELFKLTGNQEQNAIGTGVATIQSELRAFRSRIGEMESYAAAQTAYGAYMVSLGVNPVPVDYRDMPVDQLADEISTGFLNSLEPFMALSALEDKNTVNDAGEAKGNLLDNDVLISEARISAAEDDDGNIISIGSVFITDAGGKLIINSDGEYSYTSPNNTEALLDVISNEIFTYEVSDASGDQDEADLTISLIPEVNEINSIINIIVEDENILLTAGEGPDLDEYMDGFEEDEVDTSEASIVVEVPANTPDRNEFLEAFINANVEATTDVPADGSDVTIPSENVEPTGDN